jgi:hypothetical protein
MDEPMMRPRGDSEPGAGRTARAMIFVALVAAWLGSAGSEALAQGCAMCATALGGPSDPLSHGLNVSILFLLSMPFALLGTVGAWFFYIVRLDHRRRSTLRLLAIQKEGTS